MRRFILLSIVLIHFNLLRAQQGPICRSTLDIKVYLCGFGNRVVNGDTACMNSNVVVVKASNPALTVTSFEMTVAPCNDDGDALIVNKTGESFNSIFYPGLRSTKRTTYVYLNCIKAVSKEGREYILPSALFELSPVIIPEKFLKPDSTKAGKGLECYF